MGVTRLGAYAGGRHIPSTTKREGAHIKSNQINLERNENQGKGESNWVKKKFRIAVILHVQTDGKRASGYVHLFDESLQGLENLLVS